MFTGLRIPSVPPVSLVELAAAHARSPASIDQAGREESPEQRAGWITEDPSCGIAPRFAILRGSWKWDGFDLIQAKKR
jgi:hypothetical protein